MKRKKNNNFKLYAIKQCYYSITYTEKKIA